MWLCKWQKNSKLGCKVNLSPDVALACDLGKFPGSVFHQKRSQPFPSSKLLVWEEILEERDRMGAMWQEERYFRSFGCKELCRKSRDSCWCLSLGTFLIPANSTASNTFSPPGHSKWSYSDYFVITCGFRPRFSSFSGSLGEWKAFSHVYHLTEGNMSYLKFFSLLVLFYFFPLGLG